MRWKELQAGSGTKFSWEISGLAYMVFFFFSPASSTQSCSFCYSLKDLFPLHKLDDKVVLGRWNWRWNFVESPPPGILVCSAEVWWAISVYVSLRTSSLGGPLGRGTEEKRERRSPAIYIVYLCKVMYSLGTEHNFFCFKSSIYFFLCKRGKSERQNETQGCLNNLIFL